MRIFRRAIILVGLLSSLMFVPTAVAAPVLNVQPGAGPPGTLFLFFASGFAAREPISIWLNAPDGRVLAASAADYPDATAYGDATWTWLAPNDAPLGGWQMVAHGRESGIEQVIPFTVGSGTSPGDAGQPFNVVPADGLPGAIFRFYAIGFDPGERVDVSVNGPAGQLKSPALIIPGVASPSGRIDGSWIAPVDAAPGTWYIVARGKHSDVVRSIPVRIDVPDVAQPAMTIQPSLGTPGARFVASAIGFGPDEFISVWLNAPDGRVLAATVEGRAQAGPDGRASWGWIAPDDAPRGDWQMVAHGRDSGMELVANFTVQ